MKSVISRESHTVTVSVFEDGNFYVASGQIQQGDSQCTLVGRGYTPPRACVDLVRQFSTAGLSVDEMDDIAEACSRAVLEVTND